MRSMSLSKRLAMVGGIPQTNGNQTIDLSMIGGMNNFHTLEHQNDQLNNTALIAHQFNTIMV